MSFQITWHGHSTFSLQTGEHSAVIDPFFTGNPVGKTSADSLNPQAIILSHAHGDHIADAIPIATRTGATIICNFEMGNWFAKQGVENIIQGNHGGTADVGFLQAKWTRAYHSSSFPDGTYGGEPNGYVISIDDKKVYFAGDTSLFSDMKLIGEVGIEVALIPIGDLFTMGVDDSIKATQFVGAKYVIPMHYNTFPPIQQDVQAWADRIKVETDSIPLVLEVDGSHIFE